ncbi:MAG: hypothetical protein IJB86_08015 [Clostridia bacterium]|nr:hypothetical protein [Clostridia bacterium]
MKIKRCFSLFMAMSLLVLASCTKSEPVVEETKVTEPLKQVRYTDVPQSVKKSETVYVNLDSSGKVSAVSVTDWLHTDKGKVKVNDVSCLSDITDIKGNNIPEKNGDLLTWHMDTTDLYYKGTTNKQLPVEFDIDYFLDGKEYTAEEIKGKKGDVEIRVKMKNTCFKTDENGNKVFLPVLTAGLVILPENTFSSVNIENGLCIGDASKQILVGLAFPGMSESLGLTEDVSLGNIKIADSFTVTASTDSFALGNIYFAVLPICSMSVDTLIPGSETEAAALLKDIEGLMNVFGKLDIEAITKAFSQNPDSVKDLTDAFSDVIELYDSNKKLLDVMSKYLTEENIETISKLSKAMSNPQTAEAIKMLQSPIMKSFLADLPELLESADELAALSSQLEEDMKDPEVRAAMENLPQTLETLSALQKTLEENKALTDALSAFASEDIAGAMSVLSQRLADEEAGSVISYLTANSETIMPRIKSWIAFGKEYGLFTGSAENTDINLMFIYMTPTV